VSDRPDWFPEKLFPVASRFVAVGVARVWGDRDFAFRDKERKRFESLFRRPRTVVLPGAGHFIQEDAPEQIARAIRNGWATLFRTN